MRSTRVLVLAVATALALVALTITPWLVRNDQGKSLTIISAVKGFNGRPLAWHGRNIKADGDITTFTDQNGRRVSVNGPVVVVEEEAPKLRQILKELTDQIYREARERERGR
jgi:hypothetical protein